MKCQICRKSNADCNGYNKLTDEIMNICSDCLIKSKIFTYFPRNYSIQNFLDIWDKTELKKIKKQLTSELLFKTKEEELWYKNLIISIQKLYKELEQKQKKQIIQLRLFD